jgi:hypothetical protein
MKDFTVAIYVFLDDLCKILVKKPLDSRRKLTESQVMTTVILAARYFHGNHWAAMGYLRDHWGFTIPDKSNFNRNLYQVSHLLEQVSYQIGENLKEWNTEKVYIIDSFPVSMVRNIRIKRARLCSDERLRGYNASKKEYFYGIKVHMIVTGEGLPVEYFFSVGSMHDNLAMQSMAIDLPEGSHLYGDKAYGNEEYQVLFAHYQGIKLKAVKKQNSLQPDTWAESLENKYFRKQIEVSFSQITAQFPRKIHAVSLAGFLLKVLLFILAFLFEKLV